MTPDSIRAWCDEAAKATTPNDIASRLNDALWRLRTAADAIERKDVALKVALNGKISEAAEDIITSALSDHHPTAFLKHLYAKARAILDRRSLAEIEAASADWHKALDAAIEKHVSF